MLKQLMTPRIHGFEGDNQDPIGGEVLGRMHRIGAPYVIGHMVQHVTDKTKINLCGQDGRHERPVYDLHTGPGGRRAGSRWAPLS